MKLIILRSHLVDSLSALERAVPTNPNLPILESVLINAEEGKIILSSTNLEMGVQCALSGKIEEKGSIAVPFKVFADVLRNLHNERIILECIESKIRIITDNYEATIQGQDYKEFPIIPGVENEVNAIKIKTSLFRECVSSVIIATQFSEIRPEISGVYVHVTGGRIYFVGTDGFRLAERLVESTQATLPSELPHSSIIPLKSASDVIRIFSTGDAEENISIVFEQHQVHFITAQRRVVSRLIDGKYPDYQAIIPQSFQTEVRMQRNEFIDAVKLVSSFSGRTNDVTLKSGINGDFLELTTSDSALGESVYRVKCKMTGGSFSIIFNWKYLMEGLKVYKDEDVVMKVNATSSEKLTPALIKGANDQYLQYVLMPIKG